MNVTGLDKYLFKIGFAEDEAIRVLMHDAVGTKFQLAAALFTGDIKRAESLQSQDGLQDKSRLTDSWFAADQDQ